MVNAVKRRVAILISGRGSNMAALIAAARTANFPAEIAVVISNKPDAAGLAKAKESNVATLVIDSSPFGKDRAAFEAALQAALFLSGGTVAGVYTLGTVLIRQDYRGQRLALVSTAFGMAYSAGSVIGATPIGYLIDLFGVEALPATVGGSFLLLSLLVAAGGLRRARNAD